jgi:hypothetical protein
MLYQNFGESLQDFAQLMWSRHYIIEHFMMPVSNDAHGREDSLVAPPGCEV